MLCVARWIQILTKNINSPNIEIKTAKFANGIKFNSSFESSLFDRKIPRLVGENRAFVGIQCVRGNRYEHVWVIEKVEKVVSKGKQNQQNQSECVWRSSKSKSIVFERK